MYTEKFIKVAYGDLLCCRTATPDDTVMELDPLFHSGLESAASLEIFRHTISVDLFVMDIKFNVF